MIFDCCETGKRKTLLSDDNLKARPALGKNKAPLSPLSRFNKTCNEADRTKTCILACVDSHYEPKIV